MPFTTGLLIGIGETIEERVDTLLAIRGAHERHGHVHECIVQNFRAKPGTRMALSPEPSEDEMLATIALARLILPPDVTVQAPPNLAESATTRGTPPYARYIDAGINDWGGVSPVTPDHVNPERPWPHLEELERGYREQGLPAPRTPRPPSRLRPRRRDLGGREAPPARVGEHGRRGLRAGSKTWAPGTTEELPREIRARRRGGCVPRRCAPSSRGRSRAPVSGTSPKTEIALLFTARGTELAELCRVADELRREVNGDEVTYVVNRNINYTNQCYFRCRFCAFSKGPKSLNLRGDPYLLDTTEVARRAREAWEKGATEVCMQGGIHGQFTGKSYLEYLRAVKEEVPEMHVHAFTPLEVSQGARTLGLSVEEFLRELKEAGLGTLPGTAAEILDDEIRAIICPDKIDTAGWSDVMRAAHAVGLRSTTTIMFGHVEGPVNWARHLHGPARHPGRDRRLHRVRAAALRAHGRAALLAGTLAQGPDLRRGAQDARGRAGSRFTAI